MMDCFYVFAIKFKLHPCGLEKAVLTNLLEQLGAAEAASKAAAAAVEAAAAEAAMAEGDESEAHDP